MDVLLITVIRLVVPVAIFKWPLPAFYAAGQLDKFDWGWLQVWLRSEHEQQLYQIWDKSLDTYTLAIAALTTRTWKDDLARRIALAAFAFRVFGVLLFMISGNRGTLILFVDVFERLFLFYLIYRFLSKSDVMFRNTGDVSLVLFALAIPKIFEEYLNHAVGSRPWHTHTLLPPALSTPRLEYWTWTAILLALPAAAMVRLLLANRKRRRVGATRATQPLRSAYRRETVDR